MLDLGFWPYKLMDCNHLLVNLGKERSPGIIKTSEKILKLEAKLVGLYDSHKSDQLDT